MIEHCGLIGSQPAPSGLAGATQRLIFLGDDADGRPLEIMAVELAGDQLLVIHAMPLREKYRSAYEEVKKWRG